MRGEKSFVSLCFLTLTLLNRAIPDKPGFHAGSSKMFHVRLKRAARVQNGPDVMCQDTIAREAKKGSHIHF